jgi:hypothetical protein
VRVRSGCCREPLRGSLAGRLFLTRRQSTSAIRGSRR